MNPAIKSTANQRRLLVDPKGYFFEACLTGFEFLVEDGFRAFPEDVGRDCYRMSFKKDSPTGYFTVRIYHENDDLLWCDLECVAGGESKVRLAGACALLGVAGPPERLVEGPVRDTVVLRVREIAALLRIHIWEFHRRLRETASQT
jgi:hypothetical protein